MIVLIFYIQIEVLAETVSCKFRKVGMKICKEYHETIFCRLIIKNPSRDVYCAILGHFRGKMGLSKDLVLQNSTKKFVHWVDLSGQLISRNHVFRIFMYGRTGKYTFCSFMAILKPSEGLGTSFDSARCARSNNFKFIVFKLNYTTLIKQTKSVRASVFQSDYKP